MSDYSFGYGKGKVTKRREQALNRIARKHSDGLGFFHAIALPDGPCYWFSIPNQGWLLDQPKAEAIIAEAESKGLWPISPA